MRLVNFLTEADAPSGDAPPEKKEKTPEQEAAEQRVKDLDKIVDGVKASTDKNKMNNMVKTAATLYKEYGEEWLNELEQKLSVDIVPEVVKRFIEYTKNFSEKLTFLKDPTDKVAEKYLQTEEMSWSDRKQRALEWQVQVEREWREWLHKNMKSGFIQNDVVGMTVGPEQVRFKFQYASMDTKWFIKTFLDKYKKDIKNISDSHRHIDVFLKGWK